MSAATEQQQQQLRPSQRYEHLSKKTRIELEGAKNDHNYNQPAPDSPPPLSRLATKTTQATRDSPQSPEPEPAVEALAGQMDDCMAAMVLMFLSTRPNNQQQAATGQQLACAQTRTQAAASSRLPAAAKISSPKG